MFPKTKQENMQYVHGNIITKKLQVKIDKSDIWHLLFSLFVYTDVRYGNKAEKV